jgi:uncharacterized coiled-coil protein SlyX
MELLDVLAPTVEKRKVEDSLRSRLENSYADADMLKETITYQSDTIKALRDSVGASKLIADEKDSAIATLREEVDNLRALKHVDQFVAERDIALAARDDAIDKLNTLQLEHAQLKGEKSSVAQAWQLASSLKGQIESIGSVVEMLEAHAKVVPAKGATFRQRMHELHKQLTQFKFAPSSPSVLTPNPSTSSTPEPPEEDNSVWNAHLNHFFGILKTFKPVSDMSFSKTLAIMRKIIPWLMVLPFGDELKKFMQTTSQGWRCGMNIAEGNFTTVVEDSCARCISDGFSECIQVQSSGEMRRCRAKSSRKRALES